ncbi:MAG: SDR family NAD(P)-dependent oxidoreductase [Alphaproteobacteria bacterium]
MKVAGKVVLVTGAAGAIGTELIRAVIELGAARVHAADLPEALARADFSDIDAGGEIRINRVPLDVGDRAQVDELASKATNLGLLINNAGYCRWQGALALPDPDAARREMVVNYWGPVHTCQAFAPILRETGGGIINVGAFAGLATLPAAGSYSASKAALHAFTQALRAELAPQGIPVVEAFPGPVDTTVIAGAPDFAPASPTAVADRIIEGFEAGEEDIFPDDWSSAGVVRLRADPKAVERDFARFAAVRPD